jgi:hypothetical protein
MWASTGTEVKRRDECYDAQFRAAEKDGKGMAFKGFTGAKPFLKAHIKPFAHGNRNACGHALAIRSVINRKLDTISKI